MNNLVSEMDPAGQVPNPDQPITIEVEGMGSMCFEEPEESIASLASQVIVMETAQMVIVDSPSEFTVTAWDPESRHMTVRRS